MNTVTIIAALLITTCLYVVTSINEVKKEKIKQYKLLKQSYQDCFLISLNENIYNFKR